MRLACCCVAGVLLLLACYFLWRGDYGAGSGDVGGSIQDIERDVGEAQSGIDTARRENQNAREELGRIGGGIDRAAERAHRLQEQTAADRELLGEIRAGNERCQDLALELEQTLGDVRKPKIKRLEHQQVIAKRQRDVWAAIAVVSLGRIVSLPNYDFCTKIWQKTILNFRYLLPHSPKIYQRTKVKKFDTIELFMIK